MRQIGPMFLACTGLIVFMLAGCGPTRLELDYGTSYELAKSSQVLHPEAKENLAPVEGIDGLAAANTLGRYRENFKEPPPPPAFAISIGSIR